MASVNNANVNNNEEVNTSSNHQQIKHQPSAILEDGENLENESDNKVIIFYAE